MTAPKAYSGTPAEIGSDVFIDICLPILKEGSKHMQPEQLAQLYTGFVGAAFGALEADFGKELASAIALKVSKSYADQPAIDERPIQ